MFAELFLPKTPASLKTEVSPFHVLSPFVECPVGKPLESRGLGVQGSPSPAALLRPMGRLFTR